LLQAACLAGVLKAPLFVVHGEKKESVQLREVLAGCHASQVHLIADAGEWISVPHGLRRIHLADEGAVAAAHRRHLREQGPIETVIIANPADDSEGMGGMAALAPWLAVQKRAALVLTGPAGTDVDEVVTRAVGREPLKHVENLLIAANLKAVPWQRR